MWSESKGLLVYLLNTGWIGYRFKKMDFTLYLLAIWTQVIIGYYIQTNGYHQVDDNCTISSSQSQPSQTQKDNLYICRFWYHLLGCKDDWVSSFLARQMGITRQTKIAPFLSQIRLKCLYSCGHTQMRLPLCLSVLLSCL